MNLSYSLWQIYLQRAAMISTMPSSNTNNFESDYLDGTMEASGGNSANIDWNQHSSSSSSSTSSNQSIIPHHLNHLNNLHNLSSNIQLQSNSSPTSSTPSTPKFVVDMTASEHLTTPNGTSIAQVVGSHPQYTVEYLSHLLKDKKQLAAFPNVFHHLERLVDEEISKVRVALFQFEFSKDNVALPDAEGEITVHTEKVYVPAKEHPDYNFVGRILGPRGMTAKQLEQETGCKIMVRGRGSMRDKKKEEMNRGKPNWEHLSEELHVLIQCEDTENRAKVKLMRAVEEVRKLLVPAPEGEDELKRKQLMELAIINGTYRSGAEQSALAAAHLAAVKQQQPLAAAIQAALVQQQQARAAGMLPMIARSPTMAVCGAPIVMSPGGRNATNCQNGNGQSAAAAAAATSQAALLMQQQSQLHASAAGTAALASAQQAALLQQQQAAEYQQLLLNQGLYDLNAAAAIQQQYAAAGAAAQYGGILAASQQSQQAQAQAQAAAQYAEYAGVDVTTQAGAMLNNRRLLGASREHPYKQ
ncbi:unnamed protein product [Caenorhabditis angaria]|uniref:K Homology domain-containing protein n=1 Tax=Caenorhabditis angaria TaxID=860376 RepID=A0A9P1I756_9PELO|nr:unnamed protein product [Caenorhabditis angaria]